MLDQAAILDSVESRAKGLNLSMTKVCEEAAIRYETYFRWRKGMNPTLKNLNKLTGALDRLESQMRERLSA